MAVLLTATRLDEPDPYSLLPSIPKTAGLQMFQSPFTPAREATSYWAIHDNIICLQECNIFAYPDHNYLTASVPVPRLHVYVRRLVQAGHQVGSPDSPSYSSITRCCTVHISSQAA